MPRPRSPDRDKAREIYLNSSGKKPLIEIAAELGLSDTQIRKWKSIDAWDSSASAKGNVTKKSGNAKSNAAKRGKKNSTIDDGKKLAMQKSSITGGGTADKNHTQNPKARYGNQNAIGNKGGGPKGNKYAVVTHEFEKILFTDEMLDETEKALLDAPYDKFEQHLVLMKSLRIQEHRALKDIEALKKTPGGMVVDSVTKNKGTLNITNTYKNRSGDERPGDSSTEATDTATHVASPVQIRIMRIEDALIRIRGRIQKAIEVWHKMEMDAERLGIERQRLELYRQKLAGQFDLDGLLESDNLGLGE